VEVVVGVSSKVLAEMYSLRLDSHAGEEFADEDENADAPCSLAVLARAHRTT